MPVVRPDSSWRRKGTALRRLSSEDPSEDTKTPLVPDQRKLLTKFRVSRRGQEVGRSEGAVVYAVIDPSGHSRTTNRASSSSTKTSGHSRVGVWCWRRTC